MEPAVKRKLKDLRAVFVVSCITFSALFLLTGFGFAESYLENHTCIELLRSIGESAKTKDNQSAWSGAGKLLPSNYCQAATTVYLDNPDTSLQSLEEDSFPKDRLDLIAWLAAWTNLQNGNIETATLVFHRMREGTRKAFEQQIAQLAAKSQGINDLATAEQMLTALLAFSPEDPQQYENLAQFYQRQDELDKAIGVFMNGSQVTKPMLQEYLIGRADELQHQWQQAAYHYQQAVQYGDAHPLVYYHLASVLGIHLNNPNAAIPFCMKATHIAPGDYACYEMLGLLYERTNMPDMAAQSYLAGLDNVSRPSYRALIWRRLGDLAYGQRQYAQATDYYEQAIEEKSINSAAYHGLALCAREDGDCLKAIGYLEAALQERQVEADEIPADWYRELGELYESVGQKENALRAYQSVLALDPLDTLTQQKIENMQNP
jgi:tetratricopeptide (TPR) repeat protein